MATEPGGELYASTLASARYLNSRIRVLLGLSTFAFALLAVALTRRAGVVLDIARLHVPDPNVADHREGNATQLVSTSFVLVMVLSVATATYVLSWIWRVSQLVEQRGGWIPGGTRWAVASFVIPGVNLVTAPRTLQRLAAAAREDAGRRWDQTVAAWLVLGSTGGLMLLIGTLVRRGASRADLMTSVDADLWEVGGFITLLVAGACLAVLVEQITRSLEPRGQAAG